MTVFAPKIIIKSGQEKLCLDRYVESVFRHKNSSIVFFPVRSIFQRWYTSTYKRSPAFAKCPHPENKKNMLKCAMYLWTGLRGARRRCRWTRERCDQASKVVPWTIRYYKSYTYTIVSYNAESRQSNPPTTTCRPESSSSRQVVVGGLDKDSYLASVEVFPPKESCNLIYVHDTLS